MQVALASIGERAAWAEVLAAALGEDRSGTVGVPEVTVLDDRPRAAAEALVRDCDVLVLLVGPAAGSSPAEPVGGRVVASGPAAPGGAALAVPGPTGGLAPRLGLAAVAGSRRPLDVASALLDVASAARHVTVLAISRGRSDEATGRWLSALQAEYLVHEVRRTSPAAVAPPGGAGAGRAELEAAADEVVAVLAAVLSERRRCLVNEPSPEVGAFDLAGDPREGRSLDEVGPGEPHLRPLPAAEGEALGRTDRVNADEQWNEAVQAWRMEMWAPMVEHLQRALLLRPLDAESGFWLARLLAASQSTSGRAEAAQRAAQAARIAERRGRLHWAASAWLLVARLDRVVDPPAAEVAVERAAALVPHRAEPWIERALQRLAVDDLPGAAAAALRAYRHHEVALHVMARDPLVASRPEAWLTIREDVRRASIDRVVQLLQLAAALAGSDAGGVAGITTRPSDAEGVAGAAESSAPSSLGAAESSAPSSLGAAGLPATPRPGDRDRFDADELGSEAEREPDRAVVGAGAGVDRPLGPVGAGRGVDRLLGPRGPIGAAASDALVVLSPVELADEGRRLARVIHVALRQRAARVAADGRVLRGGPEPLSPGRAGRRRARHSVAADRAGADDDWVDRDPGSRARDRAPTPARARDRGLRHTRQLTDPESLLWGALSAVAIGLSGLGLWWVTGSAIWLLPAVVLMVVAVVVAYRSATEPTALAAGDDPPRFAAAREPVPDDPDFLPGEPGTALPPRAAGPPATWPPAELAARASPDRHPGGGGPAGPAGGDPVEAWRERVAVLRLAIDKAEEATLDWPRLGPAVPAYRARPGELVVPGTEGLSRTLVVDGEWLPADLRDLATPIAVDTSAGGAAVSDPTGTIDGAERLDAGHARGRLALHRLLADAVAGGVDDNGAGDVARVARWAAYFDGPGTAAADRGGGPSPVG